MIVSPGDMTQQGDKCMYDLMLGHIEGMHYL